MKRKFNKHSVRDELRLPSPNDSQYLEFHVHGGLFSTVGTATLLLADAALGGFVACTGLAISASTEFVTRYCGAEKLNKAASWTTDDGQEFSGTVQQELAYRLAQDEIYRLNALKTEANTTNVDKLLLKVNKDAKKLLGDLAGKIVFLEVNPKQPSKNKRQIGKPLKV